MAAAKGHDLQWLIDTGGDLSADGVAREVGRMIAAPITAAAVNAMNPDSGEFVDMILIRVPAGQVNAMHALMAAGSGVHVYGRRCKIYPLTIVRTGTPVMPDRR
ncbi:MAG: hypothetical protein ACKPKO_29735, partial [Candidatus Fonsibacter sp.]